MCYLTQRNTAKLIKKLFGNKDVEAVLQRLDRLTQDQARIAGARALAVVHNVVQNMNVVMDSEQKFSAYNPLFFEYFST